MKTEELVKALLQFAADFPMGYSAGLACKAASALEEKDAAIKALTEALNVAVYELERINKPGSRDKLAFLRNALAQAREEE